MTRSIGTARAFAINSSKAIGHQPRTCAIRSRDGSANARGPSWCNVSQRINESVALHAFTPLHTVQSSHIDSGLDFLDDALPQDGERQRV
jgi:hypothetical protein